MKATRNKITTQDALASHLKDRRAQGDRIVFTNGCFDLLHIGHTRYLQEARQLGDLLIIGLNSDRSVQSLKKGPDRPIVTEDQRAEVLTALSCVDFVVVFDEPDPGRLIAKLQPDVLVKGGDWATDTIIGQDTVEAQGGTVVTIPLVAGVSTTHLVSKIRQTASE